MAEGLVGNHRADKGKMASLHEFCKEELAQLDTRHARRTLKHVPDHLLNFSSNDYLGMSGHPEVTGALAQPYAGARASRLVAGNHAWYEPLETKLAEMKKAPAALVFGSGYLANIGTISALMSEGDLILADKLAHACLIDGAQLSGATLRRFRHNDVAHAESILAAHRGRYQKLLIVTEHVFSMDGDRAPLAKLADVAQRYDGWLMVDDAHGLFETPPVKADIWMGTLSKTVGTYGGYVAAKRPVIEYLATASRPFIFSTGLPPSVCAASVKALEIIEREPQRRDIVLNHARRFTKAFGLPPAESAIVPIILGSNEAALKAAEKLKRKGMVAIAIRPPTVPPKTARIRFTFSANHTDEQVGALIEALGSVLP